MAPNKSGANREAIKIAVGPSAPPIILIAAESCREKFIMSVFWDMNTAPTKDPKY